MGRSLRFIAQFLSKKIKETEFPIPTSISRDGRKVFYRQPRWSVALNDMLTALVSSNIRIGIKLLLFSLPLLMANLKFTHALASS